MRSNPAPHSPRPLSHRLPSVLVAAALALAATISEAGPIGLVLPTDNDAIFSADPSQFYMYTNRNFEGVASKPWQGGQYGFVRNQRRTSAGIVFTRLHEGIDIRPVRRDDSGNPLDEIRSIADGTVVYVNDSSTRSNYGKYMVVHHDWGDGPFFSLYAHVSEPVAQVKQQVKAGDTIARMGYTGAGINRERSHLHLELAFLMSDRFSDWYAQHYTSTNHHLIFNGINLNGIDIAALYLAHRENPNISIPAFLAAHEEPYYKVLVPLSREPEILRYYSWLQAKGGGPLLGAKSWEFTFAANGNPLAITPTRDRIDFPVVTWVKPSATDHAYHTAGRITGTGDSAQLTANGSRFIQLISGAF